MLHHLRQTRDTLFPAPATLHERSKIADDIVTVNGADLLLPRFQNDMLVRSVSSELVTFEDGRIAGERKKYDTLSDGGVDRGVSVYMPDDSIGKDRPFAVLMDTAWFTGLEGHNDRIAEIIMKTLGIEVVLVGPEFSAYEPHNIGAHMNPKRLAKIATGFSIAQSAEASASIYTTLRQTRPELELPEFVYDVGESRGAMIAQIRRIYLECFGARSIGSDLTDPNMAEHAFASFERSVKLLKWPVREAIGALAVGIESFVHGEFGSLDGTIPTGYRYHIGSSVGMAPALFSGEDGRSAPYTDYAHPQHFVNFRGSGAADTAIRKTMYKDHYNSSFVELNGCHLSLGYSSVLRRLIARTVTFGEEFEPGVQLTHEQVRHIHASRPSKAVKKSYALADAA